MSEQICHGCMRITGISECRARWRCGCSFAAKDQDFRMSAVYAQIECVRNLLWRLS